MKLCAWIRRGLVSLTLTAVPLLGVAALPDDPKETLGLIHYVRPTFPVLASSQGIFEGAAWVAVGWDEKGYARDVLVLRATHPTIARAVEEAVSGWRRDPARRDKQGDNFVIEFRAEGIVVASMGGSNIFAPSTLKLDRVPRRADLDAEPHAVQQPMPAVAVDGAKSARQGRVVVTFYVDEEGRVRAPNIVEASTPEFAAATLAALKQWRYEPAKKSGRPTAYLDQWAFDFSRR